MSEHVFDACPFLRYEVPDDGWSLPVPPPVCGTDPAWRPDAEQVERVCRAHEHAACPRLLARLERLTTGQVDGWLGQARALRIVVETAHLAAARIEVWRERRSRVAAATG